MERPIIRLLGAAAIFLAMAGGDALIGAEGIEQIDLFISMEDGQTVYRIPALLTTDAGVTLAFAEKRHTGPRDHGDIDIVVRRSLDSGLTWGRELTVRAGGGRTAGNPAPVQDRTTGLVWLPYTLDNDRVFVTFSDDHGETWAEPREITADVKPEGWEWYATGPGRSIQLSTGRLLIPSDHSFQGQQHSHVIFSDDHGETWRLGGTVARQTDECAAVELDDGSVYINMRSYHLRGQRVSALSADGGETWSPIKFEQELVEPICQAGLLRAVDAHGESPGIILFSNPASRVRERMTVRASLDEARTWPRARLVNPGPSGYSDMEVLPDGRIGLLYERGDKDYWERISFARLELDWILEGDPE